MNYVLCVWLIVAAPLTSSAAGAPDSAKAASESRKSAQATAPTAPQPPPPGRLVDLGGYKLHLWCTGKGGPTVVLSAGSVENSLSCRARGITFSWRIPKW